MNDLAKNKFVSDWVHKYGDALYSWAYYKTTSEQIAKDLVQDTFMAAFESFDKFEGRSAPKSWLFAILKNKIVDHYRQNIKQVKFEIAEGDDLMNKLFDKDGRWKPDERPELWDMDHDNLLDNIEFRQIFQSCLKKLPYHWFSCIQLKYFSEKESVEICQALNITASNFWQILHRAKLQVRRCLQNHWFNS